MKAYILSDKDYQTDAYSRLLSEIKSSLDHFDIEEKQICRDELHYCIGCFGCWVKKPGECMIGDSIAAINRTMMNSDVVIYLCPIVFGQFSPNIKNAVDRWLPNILPFFATRKDGSTMHPRRYSSYPQQIIIGYADDLTAEDAQLFIDITKKHRNHVNVLIDGRDSIISALNAITLERIPGGSL